MTERSDSYQPPVHLPEPQNHGPLPLFGFLVENLFHKLDRAVADHTTARSKTSVQIEIIQQFIQQWRNNIGPNIYPAARLILADLDKGRVYNIKDFTLGKLVLKLLRIPNDTDEAQKVLNWKKNLEQRYSHTTLAEVLIETITTRRVADTTGNELSIERVNQLLDKLMDKEINSQGQLAIFQEFFDHMSNEELKYLFKIILKQNILGRLQKKFIEKWHPDAVDLFSVVNDLYRVFCQLTDVRHRLSNKEKCVQLFSPFSPQAATRSWVSYEETAQKFPKGFFIEEKLDGERIQMHADFEKNTFKWWSRRAKDYTLLYGESTNKLGAMTIHDLKNCFHKGTKSVVLDGEMLAYDPLRDVVLPFGTLKGSLLQQLAMQNGEISETTSRPMFMIFDLLYLNGYSYEFQPLSKRKDHLSRILVNPIHNVFQMLSYHFETASSAIEKAIREAILLSSEGVLLKDPNSTYQINDRNDTWIKMKPEYLEEFGENVDLTVIGRTKGNKDTYICGLREDDKFISFCSVGNGFSEEMYSKIDRLTEGKWRSYAKKPPSSDILEFDVRKPTEWIDPRDSVVLEVKARSVDIGSTEEIPYVTGTTLFNSYCRDIREDKDWTSSLSFQEYKEIKSSKSRTEKLESSHNVIARKSKKRITQNVLEKEKLSKRIRVDPSDSLFKDFVFVILSDFMKANRERQGIESLIETVKARSGLVTKTESIDNGRILVVLSTKLTQRTMDYYQRGFNVISPKWLFDCISLTTVLPFDLSHCFKVHSSFRELASINCDQYGDSYTIPIDESVHLAHAMKRVDLREEEQELVSLQPLAYLFHKLRFFVVEPSWEQSDKLQFVSSWSYLTQELRDRIESYQGTLVNDVDSASFIVKPDLAIYSRELVRMLFGNLDKLEEKVSGTVEELKTDLSKVSKNSRGVLKQLPRIVSEEFIMKSIDEGVLVDARQYAI